MFIAATAFTYVSCHHDSPKVPGVDYTNVTIVNDFPMDINSFRYEVNVYRYIDLGHVAFYKKFIGTLNVNNPTIENVDIPPHTAYQINVRLWSNDCSTSCVGSCNMPPSLPGGYPEYYDFLDNLSGIGVVETLINLPAVACN